MALGSAPSSPSSPAANPNFLPAFLMGDTSPNTTSPARNRTIPAKLASTSTPNMYPRLYSQVADQTKQSFTPHKSGPPNQGLFDSVDVKRKATSPELQGSYIEPSSVFGRSRVNEENISYSRNLNESVNLNRTDRADTNWVTVFGFSPSSLSLVLAQLSNCGVIVEKKVPQQGNWIHVKFHSLSDVPRALALNGRCLNNSIMIGVSLYYNKEAKDKENNTFTTPIRARSLRHSYISPNTSTNSVLPPQNVPQKSTGIVSKAIEYVFGW